MTLAERTASETARGYLYAVLGAVCSGSVPTLSKILLADNGPEVVAGLPVLLSGLVLLLYQPKRKPQVGSLRYIMFFGIVGAALAPLMFAIGLNETTAVNASLLANGEVLFTTVIAFSVFGERLSRGQAARGLLIVVGLVSVSTNLDLANIAFLQGLAGNLLILGATVCWSVENNLLALATMRFDTSLLSKFRNLIGGGAVMALVLVAAFPLRLAPSDMAAFSVLAFAIAAATFLFIAAVKRLGAIRMLLVWSTSTVFGAVFALTFLGEQITLPQLLGGALILAGVYLFRRGEKVPDAEPFSPPAEVIAK